MRVKQKQRVKTKEDAVAAELKQKAFICLGQERTKVAFSFGAKPTRLLMVPNWKASRKVWEEKISRQDLGRLRNTRKHFRFAFSPVVQKRRQTVLLSPPKVVSLLPSKVGSS